MNEPQPPPVASAASSPSIQNSEVLGYAAVVIVVTPEDVALSVVVYVAADNLLRVESRPVGIHGLLGSGGTVGAFGGAKAAAKASTSAFFERIVT